MQGHGKQLIDLKSRPQYKTRSVCCIASDKRVGRWPNESTSTWSWRLEKRPDDTNLRCIFRKFAMESSANISEVRCTISWMILSSCAGNGLWARFKRKRKTTYPSNLWYLTAAPTIRPPLIIAMRPLPRVQEQRKQPLGACYNALLQNTFAMLQAPVWWTFNPRITVRFRQNMTSKCREKA